MGKFLELECPVCKKPMDKMATACPDCKAAGKGMSKKQRYLSGCGCLFVGFLALGALGTCMDTQDNAPQKQTKAVATTPTPDVKIAIKALYNDVLAAGRPCDDANSKVVKGMEGLSKGKSNMFTLYGLANDAEAICSDSWMKMNALEIPDGLPDTTEETLTKALDSCQLGYYLRKESLEVMKEVFDGDQRPSKVNEYAEKSQTAQSSLISCVVGVMQGAAEAGVELEELKKKTP